MYQIPRNSLVWLLVAQVMVILPHVTRLPVWVLFLAAACVAWRVMVYQGKWRYPPKLVKVVFVVTGFAAVPVSYGQIYGVEPAVALLIVAFSLKQLEMVEKRDAYVAIMLAYFVCITEFLFEQSIPFSAYIFLCVLIITTALIGLHQTRSHTKPVKTLKTAAILLAQAVPLMIVLFVLFPRISPLWSVPLPSDKAVTGVSDTMSPGDFASLTESDELVFRATFEGQAPQYKDLYWRGLVLGEYDGATWRQREEWLRSSVYRYRQATPGWVEQLEYFGEPTQYEIVMEPSYQNWLFTLMLPAVPEDRDYVMLYDARVASRTALRQKIRLKLQSFNEYRLNQELTEFQRRYYTELPEGFNPRTAESARLLWQRLSEPQAFSNAVLSQFSLDGFVYTLKPGKLESRDSIDEFMFDTKRGFCEHYASAYTFMMRAAGIPARVVVGYQGGEYNPSSNYIAVRQFDAHAWAEIWLEGQGWVRQDPTAFVAPDRLEAGLEAALDETEDFLANSPLSLLRYRQLLWLTELRLQMDAVGHYWDTFVVGYTPELQTSLLGRVFEDVSRKRLGMLMLGIFFGVLFVIALVLLAKRTVLQRSPQDSEYLLFCRSMARKGIARKVGEGPLDYQRRLLEAFPNLEAEISSITKAYIASNYEGQPQQLSRLKKAVRERWLRSLTVG